jgi:hypothetical protein
MSPLAVSTWKLQGVGAEKDHRRIYMSGIETAYKLSTKCTAEVVDR